MNANALTPDLLLQHERFVRAIARALLRDPHAADDVVQDTWVRTLQRGPRALRNLPSWLARVAKNRALDIRREQLRRTQREFDAAAPSVQEPVDATCERLAVQRDVVAAVLELHEPYRSVVVHRYFHGLEPTEIAARLQSKPATVRTQLVRAHELLKERLDQHRPRAAWAVALLPLLEAEPVLASSASFALVGVAVMLVAAGAWTWWSSSFENVVPSSFSAAVANLDSSSTAVPDTDDAGSLVRREVAAGQQASNSLPFPEIVTPRAVLMNPTRRNYYDTGFGFESAYGGRDRKGKLRSDYEIRFWSEKLNANCVTDDTSLLVDLGELPLLDLVRTEFGAIEERVRTAAEKFFADPEGSDSEWHPCVRGHTYFVWTQDTDSDGVAAFEVVEHVAGDHCVLEWYWTEDGTYARGSLPSPKGERTLVDALLHLRRVAAPSYARWQERTAAEVEKTIAPLRMKSAEAVFRARSGSIGGNPCELYLSREHNGYMRRVTADPIDVSTPVEAREEPVGSCSGGLIPPDCKFVVTSVTWHGQVRGDGNGRGLFRVQLAEHELVSVTEPSDSIRGQWSGRVELEPGDEKRLFLAISNSSQGEMIVRGSFEPLPK